MPDHHAEDAARLSAREDYILGHPPRIAPLPPEDFTQDMEASLRELRRAAGLPLEGVVPEYTATVLRHPTLYRAHNVLALMLMADGTLTARDRELAILRVAWLCEAPFEWGEHVKLCKRMAVLDSGEIAQVITGSTAPEWSERDTAVLRATEELHAGAMICDATWAILAHHLNEQQLMELPILIGQYMGVAFIQNALRMRMMPNTPGLSAR